MVLIKTVIMTVLAFWIYTFTQPKGVLKRIKMLMARFLPGVKSDEKKSVTNLDGDGVVLHMKKAD